MEKREDKLCAVTFDDGLAEHYRVVWPILRQYQAPAAFFPIGLPLAEKRMPLTHKLHILLSETPILDLIQQVRRFFGGRVHIDSERLINPKRRFDDVLTSNLKETLIALTVDERSRLIEGLFGQSHSSEQERELVKEFFMSAEELGELKANGMDIGSHTYGHLALDTLSRSEQLEEITRGREALCNALGCHPDMFVYPHGRYNANTLGIVKGLDFKLA
ncbi:MAG: polysaccharide deacetylase family protein, partial [Candidatus Sungbacteria bacterium]|nr:polysaccharide deacetylase family protein [Candidatus Sungbacteria bacterium]